MTGLLGRGVLMMMMMKSLLLLSAQDNATLEVVYPQAFIRALGGSSVLLSCEARYNLERCHPVHAAWYKEDRRPTALDDPGRFLTTVTETEHSGSRRSRRVVTEILRVTVEDSGHFQCRAACPDETAMGHFVKLWVQEA